MSRSPYSFKKSAHDNPIRALIHWWTHRRGGVELICDAVILALAAVVLDFVVLFVVLVADSFMIEREPPALLAGLGAMLVRTMVVGAILLGAIGTVRFMREGADTMNRPRRDAGEPAPNDPAEAAAPDPDHREAA